MRLYFLPRWWWETPPLCHSLIWVLVITFNIYEELIVVQHTSDSVVPPSIFSSWSTCIIRKYVHYELTTDEYSLKSAFYHWWNNHFSHTYISSFTSFSSYQNMNLQLWCWTFLINTLVICSKQNTSSPALINISTHFSWPLWLERERAEEFE
jgi:hypothetical protein